MKAFLLLGRLGDLTTLLPVLKDEADRTQAPTKLVVAKAYAYLLDGCSYVEPLVFDGDFYEVPQAKAWAARRLSGYDLIDCSVYGRTVNVPHDMSSFNREIWRLSRTHLNFDTAKPTFDRRDLTREQKLLDDVLPYVATTGPFILFSGRGTSSPFAQGAEYLAALTRLCPPSHVLVDISNVQATRPHDLLGLYERAAGLIATDSFPLHLAQAVPELPVLALLCDGPTPWHRSAARPNHVVRRLYGDAQRCVEKDLETLLHPVNPRIRFVTTQHPNSDPATKARLQRAAEGRKPDTATWETAETPALTRTAQQIGDKPLPFVRDLIDAAKQGLRPHDILVLCNADIGIVEGTTSRLLEAVRNHGCAFAHRWDFHGPALARRLPRHESDLKQARWYAGSDFFAFSVGWWDQNGGIFPDMVWGREAWDMVMRNLMKRSAGSAAGAIELHNSIWHERHASPWEQNLRLPGNEHNRRLATTWLARYGGSWNDWQGPQRYRAG